MKILVTGGNGFIGANLIAALSAKGHEVVSVDDLSTGKEINEVRKAAYLYEDIEKVSYFDGSEVDVVFHLAALSRVQPSFKYPGEYFRVNVKGTEVVADWAKQYNVKMIYAGSSSIHQGSVLSPYATYKAMGESIVQMYKYSLGLNAHIARFYNVYGPMEIEEGEFASLFGVWKNAMKNNKPLPIYGKGTNSREWIYVKDHCEALIKIYQKGKIGQFYNIGSNKNLTNIQICKNLLNVAKKKIKIEKNVKINFIKDRPGHDIRYALNSKKIIEKLKWFPKTNFKNGLIKTFNWYLNNKSYYKNLAKKDIENRLGKI